MKRRLAGLAALMLLVVTGCDSSTGPVVPATSSSAAPAAGAGASAPAAKPTDRGRALDANEPQPGGPPMKATP